MRVLVLSIFLLILAGCVGVMQRSSSSEEVYDWGGSVEPYYLLATYAHANKYPIEIRGICASACVLKLGSGENLCISRYARIAVHEVRFENPAGYDAGERSEAATQRFRRFLPACVEKLFSERGAFDKGELTYASGTEVLSACPQIKPCR